MAGHLVVLLTIASVLILVHPDTVTGTKAGFGRWSPRRWLSKTSVQPSPVPHKTRHGQSTHKPPVTSPVMHVRKSSSKPGLPGHTHNMNPFLQYVQQLGKNGKINPTTSHNVVTNRRHERTTARASFRTERHVGTTGRALYNIERHVGTTGRALYNIERHVGTTGRALYNIERHVGTTGRALYNIERHVGTTGRALYNIERHVGTTGRAPFTTEHHSETPGRAAISTGHPEGTAGRTSKTTGHHEGTLGRTSKTTGHHEATTGRTSKTTGHPEGTTGRTSKTTGHHEGTTGQAPYTTSRREVNQTEEWYNNTTPTPPTSSVFYICQDKTVINVTDVCNGDTDCPDGSDETPTICQLLVDADTCPLFYIACDNSTKCIHVSQLCDGVVDCADGHDEKKCGFQCADGIFHIHLSSVCNNKRDCWDGSDELTQPGTNCSCSEFACPTGKCIEIQEVANAGAECWGRVTPVKNHTDRFCSRPSEFLCDNDTNCRPATDRCDNFKDCLDGSDEMKADMFGEPVCDCASFVCLNSTCIPMDRACDGVNDCGDYSDELLAECTPNRPRKCGTGFEDEEFQCGDGTCIKKMYKCDGKYDCLNGADEHYSTCYVKPVCHEFTCSNGNCISKSLVCNNFDDCDDFSDELGCTSKNNVVFNDDDDDDYWFDDNLGLYVPLTVFCGVIIFFVTVAIIAAVVRRNVKRNARVQRSRDVRARMAYTTPVFVGPPSYSEAIGGNNVQRKTECSFVNPLNEGNTSGP